MRVIAGEWRGRRLRAPAGEATRPTADRTRETLFSMLVSRLGGFEGLRVADLFAGSGAMGIEALSRGAALACFVEQDRAALDAIRANLDALGATDRAVLRATSALRLPPDQPFDLIIADPPYAPKSGTDAARAVVAAGWLAQGGWLAIETAREERVECERLAVAAERQVGRARLTLLAATP